MRARLLVFPIKGRNWCFSRSIDNDVLSANNSQHNTPSTLKELWKKMSNSSSSLSASNELLVDFVSNKMNKAWTGLEKAPAGSFKNKIHGLGSRLLARVKPSEIFLKSLSKEVTSVEIIYPSSLNPQLVRRRLRHIAMRGTIIHRNYFYGSVTLLPLTSALAVLPLPNIPFFWVLFRTYSHWRALQGSEKLLRLVSDSVPPQKPPVLNGKQSDSTDDDKKHVIVKSVGSQWVLQPSKELDKLLHQQNGNTGLSQSEISDICRIFDLNTRDVLKYRDSLY